MPNFGLQMPHFAFRMLLNSPFPDLISESSLNIHSKVNMFEGLYLTLRWIKGITTMATATLLSGYVMDLQTFDKVLLKAQKSGKVTIEKNMITDIQSATFEI